MANRVGTTLRNIRIDDDLWAQFGAVLPDDVDRSEALRAYMRWLLRRRDGYLIERLSKAEIAEVVAEASGGARTDSSASDPS